MNTATQTVTVKTIEAKPEYDPMVNIAGHHTKSEFWLDPRTNECGVSQEMQTNSTTEAIWHGHVLVHRMDHHPHEDDLRETLDDHMDLIQRIVSGYDSRWNGNNHVGSYTDDADSAWEELKAALDKTPAGYAYWQTDEWCEASIRDTITADSTDEEIAELAAELVATEGEVIDGLRIVFDGDEDEIAELCRDHRQMLQDERDAEF